MTIGLNRTNLLHRDWCLSTEILGSDVRHPRHWQCGCLFRVVVVAAHVGVGIVCGCWLQCAALEVELVSLVVLLHGSNVVEASQKYFQGVAVEHLVYAASSAIAVSLPLLHRLLLEVVNVHAVSAMPRHSCRREEGATPHGWNRSRRHLLLLFQRRPLRIGALGRCSVWQRVAGPF